MKRVIIKFNTLLVALLIMGLLSSASAAELNIGQLAPSFNLSDQAHESHSLEDYSGKWVVLYFYPKDDTPGCTKEACELFC